MVAKGLRSPAGAVAAGSGLSPRARSFSSADRRYRRLAIVISNEYSLARINAQTFASQDRGAILKMDGALQIAFFVLTFLRPTHLRPVGLNGL